MAIIDAFTPNNDKLSGTSGDDIFTATSVTFNVGDVLVGAGGNDSLNITTAGAVTDAEFDGVSDVQTLTLSAKTGAYTVHLGANSDDAGIQTVDASATTGAVTIDASERGSGVDIYVGKGTSILTGTMNDDNFYIAGANLTKATINGVNEDGNDAIWLTDKANLTDAAFAKIKNINILHLTDPTSGVDPTGQKVVLGVNSDKSGLTEIDIDNSGDSLIDTSARKTGITVYGNDGNDVLISSGQGDVLWGGAGDDSYRVKLAGGGNIVGFYGGSGDNDIHVLDSGFINDSAFVNVRNVATLYLDGTKAQDVFFQGSASKAGFNTVDASKVTGGLTFAANNAFTNDVTVIASKGADDIEFINYTGDATIRTATALLTAADLIIGNGDLTLAYTDAVKLTDKNFLNLQVSGVSTLEFDNSAAAQSLVGGKNFSTFITNSGITNIAADAGGSPFAAFTFDFSQYTGPTLDVTGSRGHDTFIAGATDMTFDGTGTGLSDTFSFASAYFDGKDTVSGSIADGNEIRILDDKNDIVDDDFQGVTNISKLTLAASKTGSYTVTFGPYASGTGIDLVDASLAGVNATISVAGLTGPTTVLASTKDNTLTGSDQADTFVFDGKTLTAADHVNGGKGVDTLRFSTAGVITAAALANVQNVEVYQLSDAGNSIALGNAQLTPGLAVTKVTEAAYGIDLDADVIVIGGKGVDTVDFSAITNPGKKIFVAGTVSEKMTGSNGDNDIFAFLNSININSGDVINGGFGYDYLYLVADHNYIADQFRNVKNIEEFDFLSADDSTGVGLALNNAVLAANGTLIDATHRNLVIATTSSGDDTIDASLVTGSLTGITTETGGGNDVLRGGAGNDIFRFDAKSAGGSFEFDGNDTIAGGAGSDTISLTNETGILTTLSDANLAHVKTVEQITLSGDHIAVNLGKNAETSGIFRIDARGVTDGLTLDASAEVDRANLKVYASAGDDTITFGTNPADAEVWFYAATSALTAADHLSLVSDSLTGSLYFSGSATIADGDFANTANFTNINLQDGSFTLTLGSIANSKLDGAHIDASHTTGGNVIDVSGDGYTNSVVGGAYADTITGGTYVTGGNGGDILISDNSNYVYTSAGQSVQRAAGDLSMADEIFNFNGRLDFGTLSFTKGATIGDKTDGDFIDVNTTGFFNDGSGNNLLMVQYSATLDETRLYIDTNKNHNFDLNQDMMIRFDGNVTAALTNASNYTFHS